MISQRKLCFALALRLAVGASLLVGGPAFPAEAGHHKDRHHHKHGTKAAKAAPSQQAAPEPAAEVPPPYERQMLRLAEILGALSYLDEICDAGSDDPWRAKMQALIEAEAKTKLQKERLAGTFNRGFRGYEMSYHACTTNARAIIDRFLAEGRRLAHEIVDRYGAS